MAALRVSEADPRPRHRGVSHHSLTAYGRVALAPADVARAGARRCAGCPGAEQVTELVAPRGPHRLVEVPLDGLDAALAATPVPLSTMGRGLEQDPAAFLAAAAAGRHAADLLAGPSPRPV